MRQVTIPAVPEKIVDEDVTSITIESTMKTITIILTQYQNSVRIGHRSVNLGTPGYVLLMETPNPEWAPNKPLGSFRKDDIYAVMGVLGIL
jgi:hypothetical protein